MFGLKFCRQVRIEAYIVEFYCYEYQLIIELDGVAHDNPKQVQHDAERNARLEKLGYRVLRVPNGMVIKNAGDFVAQIRLSLPSPGPSGHPLPEGEGTEPKISPSCTIENDPGFSLVECLVALSITLSISLFVFQLFQQNAAAFNDQNTLSEMQQNARLVTYQIADEIRLAGQEMPIYGSIYDTSPYEPQAAILNGSTSSRINFRAGLSAIDTNVTGAIPQDFAIGTTRTIGVGSAAALYTSLGSTPSGRFVYIWGPGANGSWGWIRAAVSGISSSTNTVTLTPQQIGDGCRNAGPNGILGDADDFERFTSPPTLSLEEATAVFLNAGSIWQASASNMTNLTTPTWSAAQEVSPTSRP